MKSVEGVYRNGKVELLEPIVPGRRITRRRQNRDTNCVLDILVCHASADREVAEQIASRIRMAGPEVWLDQTADDNIATAWEGGQSYAGIILVLSPDSVPPLGGRTAWHAVLDHREHHAHPPMAIVLAGPCTYPAILERKDFFRWGGDARETLRAISRWAVALLDVPDPPFFEPAPLPWFEGRDGELDSLWESLVDAPGVTVIAGSAGTGKTAMAQEFARRASAHFRGLLWVACGERNAAGIAGDVAAQLGTTGCELLAEHRVLLVLDDATRETPRFDAPGRASVLITTRETRLDLGQQSRVILRDRIRFPKPLATPTDADDLNLWRAMSVCRRQNVPVRLAGEIAGLGSEQAMAACDRLAGLRLVDPLDRGGSRVRLSARSVAAALKGADIEILRGRHADALRVAYAQWTAHAERCRMLLAEAETAVHWEADRHLRVAVDLGQQVAAFLCKEGRAEEAAGMLRFLRDTAADRQNDDLALSCAWQLSWVDGTLPDGSLRVGEQLALQFGG